MPGMRFGLRWVAVALVAAVLAPAPGPQAGGENPTTAKPVAVAKVKVKMKDDVFKPKTVTISKGTKVKWVNRAERPHTTTGPGWDSTVSPGGSYAKKFKKVGTYKYVCTFHSGMKGKIVVV